MREAHGGTFSIQDFYVKAFLLTVVAASDYITMYSYLVGQKVTNVTFQEKNTWQDIIANFDLVDSITLYSNGSRSTYLELDNIMVNAATAVPEPASMALLDLGMLGTGVMARRRRQCTTTAC